MAQRLEQQQQQLQQQLQQQRLSQQQMLYVQLLEMPLTELEENVRTELEENPALDLADNNSLSEDASQESVSEGNDEELSFEDREERDERSDELNAALERLGDSEELPVYSTHAKNTDNEYGETVFGQTLSFHERLQQQINEYNLDERQRKIMEYLIGSLDDDGLLRKSVDDLADELAIYHNIDATPDEIREVLKTLQSFDPAGIGAQSLQECLLLQLDRRKESPEKETAKVIVGEKFELLTRNAWDKIAEQLKLSVEQTEAAKKEIHHLNPKPGNALNETPESSQQHITPDFITDTRDDGSVTLTVNFGNVPELQVSQSFADMMNAFKNNKEGMSKKDKEALLYAKEKVSKAQGFIEAVKQRQRTLTATMKAIIELQHHFFQDGDEQELRPMVLKDVAQKTGLDISTISRVCAAKYVQTPWGIFPLKRFFMEGYTTESGEIVTANKIKTILQELVEGEDEHHPLSDSALCEQLRQRGYPVARRTVAKYREDIGIPTARERKK